MELNLSDHEIRVLGSLMEKEMATPEYYPLTINALVAACNQKSNREPVTDYPEDVVEHTVQSLIEKQLAYETRGARAKKYGQNFTKRHNLVTREAAVLCVMMLRGPQTVGELKQRTARMHGFTGFGEVEKALASLADLGFVKNLGKRPGQREERCAHILGKERPAEEGPPPGPRPETILKKAGDDRVAALEKEVAHLKEELAALRRELNDLKYHLE